MQNKSENVKTIDEKTRDIRDVLKITLDFYDRLRSEAGSKIDFYDNEFVNESLKILISLSVGMIGLLGAFFSPKLDNNLTLIIVFITVFLILIYITYQGFKLRSQFIYFESKQWEKKLVKYNEYVETVISNATIIEDSASINNLETLVFNLKKKSILEIKDIHEKRKVEQSSYVKCYKKLERFFALGILLSVCLFFLQIFNIDPLYRIYLCLSGT